jgi:ComF family protein
MHRLIEVGKGKTIDVWYCFGYTSSISALVEELKYGDKPGLAEILVPYMASALVVRPGRRTRVVPVPVHPSKRRERGYNQSGLLAEGLARSLGLRFGDVLAKTRATVSQTGLDREVRLRNVTGSIGVKKAAAIPFGRALLVDDVVTTGSTLRECACALEAAGVREIGACAVASSA